MNKTQEENAVANLISKGYKVEVVDPQATSFNYKYFVYRETAIGPKSAITDEQGNLIGSQG